MPYATRRQVREFGVGYNKPPPQAKDLLSIVLVHRFATLLSRHSLD